MQTEETTMRRYQRIYSQLQELLEATEDKTARMATTIALLHHKMPQFFWTGFYILREGDLTVGPYQGSLACQILEKNRGICWAGVNTKQTVIVPDLHKYPDHITCDRRSNSEIVVPLFDRRHHVWAVLDVDSRKFDAFSDVDRVWLEKIVNLV